MATTVQPTVVSTTTSVYGERQMWSSSLFSCCDDMGICCVGWCFPCGLACQVSSDHGEGFCLPLLDDLFATLVPPVALALRVSVRERHRIEGSICGDCCAVTFCTTCSYCQLARELKERQKRTVCQVTATTVHVNAPAYAPQYPAAPYHDAQLH